MSAKGGRSRKGTDLGSMPDLSRWISELHPEIGDIRGIEVGADLWRLLGRDYGVLSVRSVLCDLSGMAWTYDADRWELCPPSDVAEGVVLACAVHALVVARMVKHISKDVLCRFGVLDAGIEGQWARRLCALLQLHVNNKDGLATAYAITLFDRAQRSTYQLRPHAGWKDDWIVRAKNPDLSQLPDVGSSDGRGPRMEFGFLDEDVLYWVIREVGCHTGVETQGVGVRGVEAGRQRHLAVARFKDKSMELVASHHDQVATYVESLVGAVVGTKISLEDATEPSPADDYRAFINALLDDELDDQLSLSGMKFETATWRPGGSSMTLSRPQGYSFGTELQALDLERLRENPRSISRLELTFAGKSPALTPRWSGDGVRVGLAGRALPRAEEGQLRGILEGWGIILTSSRHGREPRVWSTPQGKEEFFRFALAQGRTLYGLSKLQERWLESWASKLASFVSLQPDLGWPCTSHAKGDAARAMAGSDACRAWVRQSACGASDDVVRCEHGHFHFQHDVFRSRAINIWTVQISEEGLWRWLQAQAPARMRPGTFIVSGSSFSVVRGNGLVAIRFAWPGWNETRRHAPEVVVWCAQVEQVPVGLCVVALGDVVRTDGKAFWQAVDVAGTSRESGAPCFYRHPPDPLAAPTLPLKVSARSGRILVNGEEALAPQGKSQAAVAWALLRLQSGREPEQPRDGAFSDKDVVQVLAREAGRRGLAPGAKPPAVDPNRVPLGPIRAAMEEVVGSSGLWLGPRERDRRRGPVLVQEGDWFAWNEDVVSIGEVADGWDVPVFTRRVG